MNELKPEDVMKALECCERRDCERCHYKQRCGDACILYLCGDALALLREKDAAHKELWEERMRIYQDLQEYKAECKKLLEEFNRLIDEKDAEIERLRADLHTWKDIAHRETGYVEKARAEAIADVVAQLEAEVYSSDKYIAEYDGSKVQVAYNQGLKNALKIVKEMEDGENGESDL